MKNLPHGVTPCAVTLDSEWNEGVIKKRLEAESFVSFRLWLKERKKTDDSNKGKRGKTTGANGHNGNVADTDDRRKKKRSLCSGKIDAEKNGADGKKKKPLRDREKTKRKNGADSKKSSDVIKKSPTKGPTCDGKKTGAKNGADAKSADAKKKKTTTTTMCKSKNHGEKNDAVDAKKSDRIKVLNFKEKKRKLAGKESSRKSKDDDKKARASRGGSDGCETESESDSDDSDNSDEDFSSDDGGPVVDTGNFNQKQARDLVRSIQKGETKKRLPTRADKLFAPWQLAASLPSVPAQICDSSNVESPAPIEPDSRAKLRVLSLFDGISTALVALKVIWMSRRCVRMFTA